MCDDFTLAFSDILNANDPDDIYTFDNLNNIKVDYNIKVDWGWYTINIIVISHSEDVAYDKLCLAQHFFG